MFNTAYYKTRPSSTYEIMIKASHDDDDDDDFDSKKPVLEPS